MNCGGSCDKALIWTDKGKYFQIRNSGCHTRASHTGLVQFRPHNPFSLASDNFFSPQHDNERFSTRQPRELLGPSQWLLLLCMLSIDHNPLAIAIVSLHEQCEVQFIVVLLSRWRCFGRFCRWATSSIFPLPFFHTPFFDIEEKWYGKGTGVLGLKAHGCMAFSLKNIVVGYRWPGRWVLRNLELGLMVHEKHQHWFLSLMLRVLSDEDSYSIVCRCYCAVLPTSC